MSSSLWRIGQILNTVQSSFVGLLRIWAIPIVLLLSLSSGYTTYYGMSYFITGWIALIITVAVQSIIVICTLELASVHWRANLPRFISILSSLLVALVVSISFSYFKFYEFSQRDNLLIERHFKLEQSVGQYLDQVANLKSELIAAQKNRAVAAASEAEQAYLGAHPAMQGTHRNKVGRGPFWSHYHEAQLFEQAQLDKLGKNLGDLDQKIFALRTELQGFSFHMNAAAAYEKVQHAFHTVQIQADDLAAQQAHAPLKAPSLPSFAEFSQAITPSFAMWDNISWFALACAAMVDFFVLILSFRLESSAPGPLTEEEKDLAFQGLKQFNEFHINGNDELEFLIEKTELERARRYSDWSRMFAVAFLLNRGYLRKISEKAVEFAPNLYPVIAERLKSRRGDLDGIAPAANEERLLDLVEKKRHV